MMVELIALGTIAIVTILDIYMLKRLFCKKEKAQTEIYQANQDGNGSYRL